MKLKLGAWLLVSVVLGPIGLFLLLGASHWVIDVRGWLDESLASYWVLVGAGLAGMSLVGSRLVERRGRLAAALAGPLITLVAGMAAYGALIVYVLVYSFAHE